MTLLSALLFQAEDIEVLKYESSLAKYADTYLGHHTWKTSIATIRVSASMNFHTYPDSKNIDSPKSRPLAIFLSCPAPNIRFQIQLSLEDAKNLRDALIEQCRNLVLDSEANI